MNKLAIILCASTLLMSGCIRRTVSVEYENRGSGSSAKTYGGKQQGDVVEEKLIWVWQKEFRNP